MTALANAAGLTPDVRGMHEPSVNLEEIPQRFSLREEGGLLQRHGVVELANSVAEDGETMLPNPIKMGVFAVVAFGASFHPRGSRLQRLPRGGRRQELSALPALSSGGSARPAQHRARGLLSGCHRLVRGDADS